MTLNKEKIRRYHCGNMNYLIVFGNEDTIIKCASKEEAIRRLDTILHCTNDFSLMAKLNDMQMEACNYDGSDYTPKAPWDSKWTIPDYFINLLLKPFKVKLKKDK